MLLNEDQLKDVVGGTKTGEYKDGKIYIKFPSIVSSFTGYYGCEDIEKLCTDYYGYKGLITPQVTLEIKLAVKDLYNKNNREIPEIVLEVLGIN